jgi:hypothetical protein
VAIDGHPIAELRSVSRTLVGGTNGWRDRTANYFFESPEQMRALGAIGAGDSVAYRFALAGGSEVTRMLRAEPASGHRPRANANRWFYPAPMPEEGDGWKPALAPDKAPWSLQEPEQPFRWRENAAAECGA